MKRENLITCAVLYIISIYVLISSKTLPVESAKFPRLVAFSLIILTSIYLYQILSNKLNVAKAKEEVVKKKLWFTIGLSVLYVFTINYIGYFLLTPIYLIATMWVLGVKDKKLMAIVTAISVGLIYIGFKVLLGVPVPNGIFFS